MKLTKKIITASMTFILGSSIAFAASPSISMNLNGALGAHNIKRNPIVSEVPGISDNSDLDFDFNIKGNFGKEASLKAAGYNSGMKVDIDALYRNYTSNNSYSSPDSKYANNYSKIQKMIDWYEANKHYYGLPDNPFPTGKWPTDDYGEGREDQIFIKNTTVKKDYDIKWDSDAWIAADALYRDVSSYIEDALYSLYETKGINRGQQVKQDEFAKMSAEQQKYALLKMEAIYSFRHISGNRTSYPVASGYADFTNIAQMFDINMNIAGARLNAGKLISSARTGQKEFGSSVRFGLTRDFVKGLNAGITLGVAGGESQRPEIWDTQSLDFNPGKYAELGVKLNADYTYELRDLKLKLSAGTDFLMPDLLVATTNNAGAFRLGVHWNDFSEYVDNYGFYLVDPTSLKNIIEVADTFEFTYTFSKDRYDIFDKASFAYGLKNELYANAYGAELKLNTSFKSKNFENKYVNQIEDRFTGNSASEDFRIANLNDAALIDFDIAYNTFRLFNSELATIRAGVDAMIYGGKSAGFGWNAGISINLKDYVKNDLIFRTDINYYKNTAVQRFATKKQLDKLGFMDYTTITAGVEYAPSKNYVVGLNFVTAPSMSLRYKTRLVSAEATVTVKY